MLLQYAYIQYMMCALRVSTQATPYTVECFMKVMAVHRMQDSPQHVPPHHRRMLSGDVNSLVPLGYATRRSNSQSCC